LNGLASVLLRRGDVEGPRLCDAEALALHAASNHEAGRAAVLGNFAELEFGQGNPEQALACSSEALAIDLRGKDAVNQAIGYNNLAAYRICLGKLDEAKSDASEALRLARDSQSAIQVAISSQHLALIGALNHNAERATRLLGFVDKAYREEGGEREPTEAWAYRKLLASLHDQLGEDEIAVLLAEGEAWSEDHAAAEAMRL